MGCGKEQDLSSRKHESTKTRKIIYERNYSKAKPPFESQKKVIVKFHGMEIGSHRMDLVIEDRIILELKAVKELLDIHMAQLRSYLKATGLKTGLLINFSKPKIEVKRIVN